MANSNSMLSSFVPYAVTLSVADIDGLTTWYVDKLGFTVAQRKHYPEFNTSLVFLEKNGFRVELIKDGNAGPGVRRANPPAHTAPHGVSQFAFQTTDVSALKQELLDHDVPITWEFASDELGVSFVFIRDPEGNLVQFLQRLR